MTAAATLLLLAALAPAQAPAPPVFAAKIDSVYVDAFVMADGRPVTGLGSGNFELRDEGVVHPAELVHIEAVPLVSVLAFDASASVSGETLRALQESGSLFLSALVDADQAGLLTFDHEVAWRVPPTTDKQQVARALAALRPRGGTALFDALFAAVTMPTASARPLVVVFSDGKDSASWLDERRVRNALARSNALVHIVGVVPSRQGMVRAARADALVRVLRELAESTGGRFWPAESPEKLGPAFAGIAEAMRRRYLLRFDPEGGKPGWHRLEVRLKNAPGAVQARPSYWSR